MLFVNKQKQIEKQIADYGCQVALCLEKFHQAVKEHCRNPELQLLEKNCDEVHRAESRADDIRREIEVLMYSKALFPESRGDIMKLLEAVDKVPNQAEAALMMILTHRITIPQYYHSGILHLTGLCHRCITALLDGIDKLFTDFTNATVAIGKVDELESEADQVEASLTTDIFTGELDGFEKLLLRDLVKNIASITDRAENAGDQIRIIMAKRRI